MTSETDNWDDLETEGQPRRKTRRIDVKDRDDCLVFIDNNAYFIRDISLAGIGLLLPVKESVLLSEVIGDIISCHVQIAAQTIRDLEYRIVYLSPGPAEYMFCGMEWVGRNQEKEGVFQTALDQL